MTTKTPATSNRLFTAQEMFDAVAADPRVKAYPKLVEALRNVKGCYELVDAIEITQALLREIGED